MTLLETGYLREKLETIELDEVNYPERLDGIIYAEGEDEEYGDMQEWIDKAENWDISPRRAVFIPDYWELDDDIEERLTDAMRQDLTSPELEGSRLATNAIQAQKENGAVGFSAVIGFEVSDLDDSFQKHQLGAPQGQNSPVALPDWCPNDDWYSDLEEDGKIGVIVDDHTVYARHIMDNISLKETEEESFDTEFWEGYQSYLENYTGLL